MSGNINIYVNFLCHTFLIFWSGKFSQKIQSESKATSGLSVEQQNCEGCLYFTRYKYKYYPVQIQILDKDQHCVMIDTPGVLHSTPH